jgi:hypothetical protein
VVSDQPKQTLNQSKSSFANSSEGVRLRVVKPNFEMINPGVESCKSIFFGVERLGVYTVFVRDRAGRGLQKIGTSGYQEIGASENQKIG